jgi:DNA-binding MarR family transcriptional regulator
MTDETKHIGRQCIGFRVRMLNRMVTSIYDDALAKAGVKTSQFNVLVAVSNRTEMKPSELAKILAMDESTLSRNVDRMCTKGLLQLEDDADRRSHRITITEKGMAVIRKAYPAWQKAQDEVSQLLGPESVAALRSALKKLSA